MKRRRKPIAPKCDAEQEILSKGRWSGVKDQWFSEAMSHSEAENIAARERCRALVERGWHTDEEFSRWLVCLYDQGK